MGDWNNQKTDIAKFIDKANIEEVPLAWSDNAGITFRSMINKSTREIDYIISNVRFESRNADHYNVWSWNFSDHKPIEASLAFEAED